MDFIIRKGVPEDAEQVLAYMDEVLAEPGINFVTEPGEFKLTLEEERKFIQRCNASDNNLYLVAEAQGKVIGLLTLIAQEKRAVRHAPELGISVRQDWRGREVGTALLEQALDWAEASPAVRRVELHVFARNTRAIQLYERVGFQLEGVRRKAANKDGEDIDDLIMGLLLDKALRPG
jgi:RimJ/RimL family protein N-acetyltransferase